MTDVLQKDTSLDILILEENQESLKAIKSFLPPSQLYRSATTVREAEEILCQNTVRVLLCADDLSDETGLMFLARTRDQWPDLRRILMAPNLDHDLFFHAMNEVRLFSYLNKPIEESQLRRSLQQALKSPTAATPPTTFPSEDSDAKKGVWAKVLAGFTMILICLAITLLAMLFLYELKSYLGIDLFPEWHLIASPQ